MAPESFLQDLARGEGMSVEFKRCGSKPGDDTYETICAFANRQGGHIYLGVEDDGTVVGLKKSVIADLERTIVATLSDPRRFDVAPSVEFTELPLEDGRFILRLWIPPGPSVYSFKGATYDRIADADVQMRSVEQKAAMYERKREFYTEREIFPYVEREDLRRDLIERARSMAAASRPDHPWLSMDDDEFLRSARLYGTNRRTGEQGLTLAAVLLLGTDEVIGDVCPAYRTDAVCQIDGTDRYEDRIVVRTNLIESYDLLADFAERHLPDRFALVGTRRVSLRDHIVRELVANSLIHREYVSIFPARIVIDDGGIRTENASRSIFEGRLTIQDLNPIPKNPIIANFFREIGRAEELGSGLHMLYDYAPRYGGSDPVFEEGDVFRAYVAVSARGTRRASAEEAVDELLRANGVVTSKMLAERLGVSARMAQRHIRRLVEEGVLVRSGEIPYAYRRA